MPDINTLHKYRLHQRSTYTRTDYPGTVFTLVSTDADSPLGAERRLTNQNVNWKEDVAFGRDASRDYHLTRCATKPVLQLCESKVAGAGWLGYGRDYHVFLGNASALVNTADDAALQELALRRLKRKLQSNIKDINVMVPLAELKDLRRTINASTSFTSDFLKTLVHLRKLHGKKALKQMSRQWLNYSFGIMPMINDTKAILDAIDEQLNRDIGSIRLTGTARKTWFSSSRLDNYQGAYFCIMSLTDTMHHDLSYRYTGGFDVKLITGNNYCMSDQLGLHQENLPSTFWELVPLSWIVDYFSTVGAYLEDTFILPPGSLKYLTLNKRYKAKCITLSTQRPSSSGCKISHLSSTPGEFEQFTLVRTKLTSLPRQTLRLKTVDEVGLYGIKKMLNLAALFMNGRSA